MKKPQISGEKSGNNKNGNSYKYGVQFLQIIKIFKNLYTDSISSNTHRRG